MEAHSLTRRQEGGNAWPPPGIFVQELPSTSALSDLLGEDDAKEVSEYLEQAIAKQEEAKEEAPKEVLHEVPLSLIQPPVAVRPHSDNDE
jgi:hypothetical protein